MHQKITGRNIRNEVHELKEIWKWLKELGHRYNITEKWKKILMDILSLNDKINADSMGFDDVLEATIVALHSK
jgi:hypothetical protein